MTIGEFINDVLDITNTREQYLTEVCVSSKYYNIVLKRLYITDVLEKDNYLIIKLNDGRVQKLYVSDDFQWKISKADL